MTAFRSYAWGSLLFALLIAMLLAVAAGGAGARADTPAAVPDRNAGAAAPAPQSSQGDGARDRADEQADTGADNDDTRDRGDIEEFFDWGHSWNSDRARRHHIHRRNSHDDTLVNFGSDSKLPAGRHADSVVSIFGSSTSDGDADDVVSIVGDTRTSGRVADSAVAVFGSAYIDGPVGSEVVAVLGDVKLGPHADVGGDVTAVGGHVIRDPAAIVRGNVQSVGGLSAVWLRPWIDQCLLYGRPLALVPGVGWAWTLSIAFLALYVCLALLFRGGVSRCVNTVESEPGMTFVAALLTVLLVPILIVLLCITVIGIAAIPFVIFGLFCASLFGKAVMLAWIGRRLTSRRANPAHPAVAVLIGGLIVLVLYLIPVVGFLVYKLLGLLGLGAVIYTLLLASRAHRAAQQSLAGGPPPASAAHVAEAPEPPAAGQTAAAAGQTAAGQTAAAAIGESVGPGAASVAGAAGGFTAGPSAAPPHTPSTPPLVASTLPRAGFWIRMVALLIDVLLVSILLNFVGHRGNLELVALAIYGAVMWKLRSSTVGGIIFDLRVVRVDGRPVDWETAIVRALSCFLSLVVAGLGFFWIAFDSGKQAWHDKIAGTAVVRVPKGVPLV